MLRPRNWAVASGPRGYSFSGNLHQGGLCCLGDRRCMVFIKRFVVVPLQIFVSIAMFIFIVFGLLSIRVRYCLIVVHCIYI